MFLDQDVFFHLGEPYDKPDEELFKEGKKELKLLANRTDMLHKALPVLCANAQASSSDKIRCSHIPISLGVISSLTIQGHLFLC